MGWLGVLTLVAAVGSGLVAGVFFAFSSFVMTALGRLPTEQGIAAMQSINVAVLRSAFLVVFLGTAAASLVLAVAWLLGVDAAGRSYLLPGSALYLAGAFLVTAAFNVPFNEELARVPATSAGIVHWQRYLRRWTVWNHVRTLSALGAAVGFILALQIA